jgi:hypothetical protein
VRLCIDGALKGNISTSEAIRDNIDIHPVRIGANSLHEDIFFTGYINEIWLRNRVLSSSKVSDVFKNKVFNTNGKIAHLSFNPEICSDKN